MMQRRGERAPEEYLGAVIAELVRPPGRIEGVEDRAGGR